MPKVIAVTVRNVVLILKEFEHMETIKIHTIKNTLKKFVTIIEDLPPVVMRDSAVLSEIIDTVSHEKDIDTFVKLNKSNKVIKLPTGTYQTRRFQNLSNMCRTSRFSINLETLIYEGKRVRKKTVFFRKIQVNFS